ncbi:MAG TPA: metallophosphoesterase family protein [Paenirhodobacter sp.]
MRAYAIGDIHGHLGLLRSAQDLVQQDRDRVGDATAPLVHLGDLVDRGHETRGVIDHLMAGQARGEPWVVLKGNHDRLFTGWLRDPHTRDPKLAREVDWLHPRVGGAATLESYGVANAAERALDDVHADALQQVPAAHRQWLSRLPLYALHDQSLFVHAGVRPGIDLRNQVEDDLVWIRAEFLEDSRDHGALIVHGHTAIDKVTHYGNRLNMDSSAAYGGPVSAAVIEGRQAWLLTPEGRVAL